VLHPFGCSLGNCPDGFDPVGWLVADGAGNLYGMAQNGGNASDAGTTKNGGQHGIGVVFSITRFTITHPASPTGK
jgi:hypothetical protein